MGLFSRKKSAKNESAPHPQTTVFVQNNWSTAAHPSMTNPSQGQYYQQRASPLSLPSSQSSTLYSDSGLMVCSQEGISAPMSSDNSFFHTRVTQDTPSRTTNWQNNSQYVDSNVQNCRSGHVNIKRYVAKANNPNGNGGRAYYRCDACNNFLRWEDGRG